MAVSVIEGRNAVLEALRAGAPVRRIMLAEGSGGKPLDELVRLAQASGVKVERVSRRMLDDRSERGAHQGVLAELEPFAFTDLTDVIGRVGERSRSLVVVLDHVTDPGNLGAVARSLEVAGGDALIVPRHRSAAIGAGAYKTSAGALAHLPVVQEPNLVRALERLKDAGYWVAGADASGDKDLWEAPLDGRLALVLGSEGEGLSRLVREACDFLVGIPVAGRVDSLNVAQAATVLAFEWVRRARDGEAR